MGEKYREKIFLLAGNLQRLLQKAPPDTAVRSKWTFPGAEGRKESYPIWLSDQFLLEIPGFAAEVFLRC